MSNKLAAVVIPFYKDQLSPTELVALRQCFKVLNNNPVIAIKPESLILPPSVTQFEFTATITFADEYFNGIAGYNRLMLSAEFYGAFLHYEYMLIYQLDAFLFKDELAEWCAKGFDYIGPPWIHTGYKRNRLKSLIARIGFYRYSHLNKKQYGIPDFSMLENRVGNGGFSLRRVKRFHELCTQLRPVIDMYNLHQGHTFNEDVFWSVEVTRSGRLFRIPGYKEALQFAFEIAPERARLLNRGNLPFGCHAWDLNIDYWRPVFKQYGYQI